MKRKFHIIKHKGEIQWDLDNEVAIEAVHVSLQDHEKCTKQPAVTVGKNVRCHLSQVTASQYIAEIVIKIIRNFNFF